MTTPGLTYNVKDTIAAIATAPGEGGVAILRISGEKAFAIAGRVCSQDIFSKESHKVFFARVIDSERKLVDDALFLPMRGPRSFTGEDVVEIHCHGGSLVSRRVLDVVIKAGARLAQPGEFSYKAFINGKIDLSQAEAIQQLVSAKNELAVDAAQKQLEGKLSKEVQKLQHDLADTAAILEAWVDFPEEGLEFASFEEITSHLEGVKKRIFHLIDTYHDGKIIDEGIALCLVGSPNVGKSSLMNALLNKERAIVSNIPGTTRDIVEDTLRLGNVNVRLIDTAGVRQAKEMIEQEGIRRTHTAMAEADLILFVLDAAEKKPIDKELLQKLDPKKTIAIWNKADLAPNPPETLLFPHIACVSAKTGEGVEELKKQIDSVIWAKGAPSKEEVVITSLRHKEALVNAGKALNEVTFGLKTHVFAEFVTMDMRLCLTELGKIIGMDVTEEVLNCVFSKFCIGK